VNQVPGHDHCIQAELAAALALSTSQLCTRKSECEESVDTVATKSLCVNAEVASSSSAAATERFVVPVPLVGMAGSYLEQPEYDAFIATVLQVLSKDDSKAAKEQTLQERDGASTAVLKNIEELIKDAKELTFEAGSQAKRVDVHHLSGLNTMFKKCTSSKMLQQVIDFLVEHCPNLCSLDFSYVKLLIPEMLRSLSRFQRLHSLSLASTDIQDEHVAALSNLPLKTCNLDDTLITGSTLSSLHRGIEDLNLSYCRNLTDAGVKRLGREVDETGQVLHEAMQLKTCNLCSAKITGSTLSSLHRGIEDLHLGCCENLTDAGVEGLGRKVDEAGRVIHEAMQLKMCCLIGTKITISLFPLPLSVIGM